MNYPDKPSKPNGPSSGNLNTEYTFRTITADPDWKILVKKHKIATPIVAVTAQAMEGDREKCLQCGFSDYVSKPIDYKRLISILKKYLNFVEDDIEDEIISTVSEDCD